MILWQTGEPPCEIDLLVEYEFKPGRKAISMLQRHDGAWRDECDEAMPPITVLRWSTLDAAPDVVGKLERFIDRTSGHTVVLDRFNGRIYRARTAERDAEAATLTEAIQKLCGCSNADTTNQQRAT